MVDADSYIPLYQQVSQIVQDKINSGELKPGERIGSISELVKTYDISRVTAVNALEDLVKKGFVISKQGKGSFVTNGHLDEDLLSLKSFVEISEGKSINYDIKITKFDVIPASNSLVDVFGSKKMEFLCVQRIHFYKNKPIALCDIFIPKNIADKVNIDKKLLAEMPVFDLLERNGVDIVDAMQTIGAIAANAEIGEGLSLDIGDPVLFAERISYDKDKKPILCAHFYYRADSYKYSIRLKRIKRSEYLS